MSDVLGFSGTFQVQVRHLGKSPRNTCQGDREEGDAEQGCTLRVSHLGSTNCTMAMSVLETRVGVCVPPYLSAATPRVFLVALPPQHYLNQDHGSRECPR
jgi:hypothetical protein